MQVISPSLHLKKLLPLLLNCRKLLLKNENRVYILSTTSNTFLQLITQMVGGSINVQFATGFHTAYGRRIQRKRVQAYSVNSVCIVLVVHSMHSVNSQTVYSLKRLQSKACTAFTQRLQPKGLAYSVYSVKRTQRLQR